jgi:hypothetical protein
MMLGIKLKRGGRITTKNGPTALSVMRLRRNMQLKSRLKRGIQT